MRHDASPGVQRHLSRLAWGCAKIPAPCRSGLEPHYGFCAMMLPINVADLATRADEPGGSVAVGSGLHVAGSQTSEELRARRRAARLRGNTARVHEAFPGMQIVQRRRDVGEMAGEPTPFGSYLEGNITSNQRNTYRIASSRWVPARDASCLRRRAVTSAGGRHGTRPPGRQLSRCIRSHPTSGHVQMCLVNDRTWRTADTGLAIDAGTRVGRGLRGLSRHRHVRPLLGSRLTALSGGTDGWRHQVKRVHCSLPAFSPTPLDSMSKVARVIGGTSSG